MAATAGSAVMPEGVARSAFIAAQFRAAEQRRPDRLVADDLAAEFLSAAGLAPAGDNSDDVLLPRPFAEIAGDTVPLRGRHVDDALARFAAGGGGQLVVLAAGFDTRAYRLEWPEGFTTFEVDLPAVVDFKERVLGNVDRVPRCSRIVVRADLADDWFTPLAAAGFDSAIPTAWVLEGLLFYLDPADHDSLLDEVSGHSRPGSVLLFDHLNGVCRNARHAQGAFSHIAAMAASFRSHIDNPGEYLAAKGWESEVSDLRQLAEEHGRPVPPIMSADPSGLSKWWCVEAHKI